MKNQHWEAIHELYTGMEKLCGKSLYVRGNLLFSDNDIKKEESYAEESDVSTIAVSGDDIVRIRAELRTQLDFLKAKLAEQYSERDSYLVLFPIVAQIDEVIQVNFLRTMKTSWPLLQKELFQIDNAGEVFYEILNDILMKPQTPVFIYEVYYFCLSYGFRGRYENNPVKITEYLKKLQTKLQTDDLEIVSADKEESGSLKYFGSPYWSYGITAGGLMVVYFFLRVMGKYF